ncbi:MAG: hypothetical protein WBF32_14090 [Candidatus Aminicenantaceae bacterium]
MARIKYKKAAGLTVKRGKPPIGKKPSKIELKKLYIKESRSIREVAEILGCTKDMVYRALKEFGIQTREHVKKSILWDYSLESLEMGIKEKGLRGFARDLGINESTLRYHIKKTRSAG